MRCPLRKSMISPSWLTSGAAAGVVTAAGTTSLAALLPALTASTQADTIAVRERDDFMAALLNDAAKTAMAIILIEMILIYHDGATMCPALNYASAMRIGTNAIPSISTLGPVAVKPRLS